MDDMDNTDDQLLQEIRAALQARIHEIGLRATAREIGISPTAAQDLAFREVRPYTQTRELLGAWMAAWRDAPPPPDARETRRALFTLTRDLPPERRNEVIERIEAILARVRGRAPDPPRPAP